MKIARSLLLILSLLSLGFVDDAPVRIFLIGDSTMADKPLIDNPEHGWGQMFPIFLSANSAVFNHAKNGRSTRNFLYEGRWDAVMKALRPGDYLFIQFGHNDAKKEDTSRFAAPQTDYRSNLIRFITGARSRKAIPVLLTPVNRRNFDSKGKFIDKHGEYPDVVRAISEEFKVPLIDLHKKSRDYFERLGPEESKRLFLTSVKPGIYRALPEGKDDNTHFTRHGAVQIAKLVSDGVKELSLPLKNEIISAPVEPLPGNGIVVGLDQYYNNEWKAAGKNKQIRRHYIWEDSSNGGFSELAWLFDRHGADVDTLQSAPTGESLNKFSAYIIVDPDTPEESAAPNYMTERQAGVIEEWVKNGGVLILLTNDSANCDFKHINILSERFGIHFNGDAQHNFRDAKDFMTGWSADLPKHPLFGDAEGLFIKQVSSLSLKQPAVSILTEKRFSLIAESRAGKGIVLAVGDPWLYNEYIDGRKLPNGYNNAKAARNFVRWVCTNGKKAR